MADSFIRPYNYDYDDNSYDHDNNHHYDHDNDYHDNDYHDNYDRTPRNHDHDNGSVVHVLNYDCGGAGHVDL